MRSIRLNLSIFVVLAEDDAALEDIYVELRRRLETTAALQQDKVKAIRVTKVMTEES